MHGQQNIKIYMVVYAHIFFNNSQVHIHSIGWSIIQPFYSCSFSCGKSQLVHHFCGIRIRALVVQIQESTNTCTISQYKSLKLKH